MNYKVMTSQQLRDLIHLRGGGHGGARTKKQLIQLLEYEDSRKQLQQWLENGPVVRISLIDGDRSAEALRQVQRDLGFSMQTSFTERCFYVIAPSPEQVKRLLEIPGAKHIPEAPYVPT